MNVLFPSSAGEALHMVADTPEATPMAGGTDLLVHWPVHLDAHRKHYVDLSGAHELRTMRWTDEALVLGALTTYWDVIQDAQTRATFPLLVDAARQVGSVQIQARGTWAGNIVNASPAADGVPVLMVYDATVVLDSIAGRREVPLSEFYRGYKEMDRRPDELVTEIRIPRDSYEGGVQEFIKVGPRRAQAITKVGVAVTRNRDGWRVVANSVAPTVRRCPAVEQFLNEGAPSAPGDLIDPIRRDVSPIDDIRSTAAYRETVLARVLFHAVIETTT